MTWSYGERLYQSLPAIVRIRDAEEGQPLRALLSVIESEVELVEADIEGLYENWFIETSDEWVVPYIGDLLGVHALHTVEAQGVYSLRAYVANTIAYRRRKGTLAVLEQLARDVTGWPARAVEFFELLETTQHQNHVRLQNVRTPDLRDTARLELLNTPFDAAAHTGEVRRIPIRRGKYNIPNIGLFLWRLKNYPVEQSTAVQVSTVPLRYRFDPLDLDIPLFNDPVSETKIEHLADEINVPGRLRRRPPFDELEAYRQALKDGEPYTLRYFGADPVLRIYDAETGTEFPPREIVICNLSDWDETGWAPRPSSTVHLPDGTSFQTQVGVDPELGRIAFLSGATHAPHSLEVSYSFGFSADLGGGPYDRTETIRGYLERDLDWTAAVSAAFPADDPAALRFRSLGAAVKEWNKLPAGQAGAIAVIDSRTYPENLTGDAKIEIKASSHLLLCAGDWPAIDIPELLPPLDDAETRLVRPHLAGDLSVVGTAGTDETPGELVVDGLLVSGQVRVLVGNLDRLTLSHCTVAPGFGDIAVSASSVDKTKQNMHFCLSVIRSITGPVTCADLIRDAGFFESVIDGDGGPAIQAPGARAEFDSVTVLGNTEVRSLQASNTLFDGTVRAERRQQGCTRFCYVPAGSRTPRRYRCQPDLALLQRAREMGLESESDLPEAVRKEITADVSPAYTSTDYGHPAYAQLSERCAAEIRTGSEDGAEIGVFNFLKQPQREANLRAALDEYLRFGLEAGIFTVT